MITAGGAHRHAPVTGARAGQVLLCGGRDGVTGTSVTGNCETFNPAGPAVLAAGAMVSPREGHAAVLLHSGRVFVTGGRRRNVADSLWIYEPMNEMYDPATGAGVWTRLQPCCRAGSTTRRLSQQRQNNGSRRL